MNRSQACKGGLADKDFEDDDAGHEDTTNAAYFDMIKMRLRKIEVDHDMTLSMLKLATRDGEVIPFWDRTES